VHTKHEFSPPEPFLCFSQRTCPIQYFRSKTNVWGGCAQFRVVRHPFLKRGSGCIQSTSFCHRNQFFVFRNEHAQSTTLGPKLIFGVVSRYNVAARHPFRKRVSGCIQSTSFCHRTHFVVFCNEHAQSTTLVPKLMFGWFRAISFPHVTHFENGCWGAYKARVFATGTIYSFFATNMPKPYFRSKTHVLGGYAQFRCRTSPIPKTGVGVHTKHEFSPPEPFLRFSQRTCPIHYFRSKTHVWGGFAQFCCRTSPIPKMGVGVHTSTSFRHRNHFFVLRNEHAQSTTLGPKLMFGVVSHNFVAARHQFPKRVSGCIQARVFATGTIYSFFATNMPNPLL
jgi:hypothetical protein